MEERTATCSIAECGSRRNMIFVRSDRGLKPYCFACASAILRFLNRNLEPGSWGEGVPLDDGWDEWVAQEVHRS